MTVAYFEIIISVLTLLLMGALAGYFISRKMVNKYAVTLDDLNMVKQDAVSLKAQLDEKALYVDKIEKELAAEREACKLLHADVASRDQEIRNLNEVIQIKKGEMEEINKKFNDEFRNIANQVIVSNSGEFNKLTTQHLNNILSPFKEQIKQFESKLDESRIDQIKESTSLKGEIKQLSSLNATMSEEARNLTNALKNQSKTRGNWGEMILEKILESSGLKKDEHYTVQTSLKGEDKNRLQPDVIIHLPENKHIIIDSKVSLVDYERYCNAGAVEEREACLKSHINSIYGHVDNLSSKEYQKAIGVNPPDFVLMFVPIESALAAALESDRELFAYAWEKNVAIISPTTLIPTLKIIYNIWRQESQNRNALAIAETGGKLYDKFVGFLNDLQQVGKSIDNAKGNYDDAIKKLSSGRGNILDIAEKMKEMGAKASKQIPGDLVRDLDN